MNHPLQHLPGIEPVTLQTSRLRTLILTSGPESGEPVLFLHGNLASSTFWEETMLALPDSFRAVAPDQRGYGLSDPDARIDATRGVADWVDDAVALADALGWERFHLIGHSLGGCVAWGLLARQTERLASVTLVAPGPPCGFGGTRGPRGELTQEDGAGSGAGLVHPLLVERLAAGERDSAALFSPRAAMNRLYWKPPFRPAREEDLLSAMLQVHLGEDRFPGDWSTSPHWPGFAPGRHGPVNALAPRYNNWLLPALRELSNRPRLLWIYGSDDCVVSDMAVSDAGAQGKLGLRRDWPGEDVFPPQPLLRQVKFALDEYEKLGGRVSRVTLAGVGHTPYLERPTEFNTALANHLSTVGSLTR